MHGRDGIPCGQSELFFDAFQRALLEIGVVHRQHRLLAVEIHLQVRAFAGLESCALLGQPALEFFTFHELECKQNCLYRQAGKKTILPCFQA